MKKFLKAMKKDWIMSGGWIIFLGVLLLAIMFQSISIIAILNDYLTLGIILSIFAIILSPIAGQYLARVGSKPERLKGEKEKAFERDFKYNKKTRQFIIDGNEVVIDDGKDH